MVSVAVEMLSRLLVGFKRRHSVCRELNRGMVRYLVYGGCLLMAVAVDVSLRRALGFSIPVVDVFMAYLILTDCSSIVGNAIRIGLPVPPLLVTLVFGGKTRVEKAILHAVDMPEKSGENGNDNLKRP